MTQNNDFKMAVGIGALFKTKYLYGLPERESSFMLKDTLNSDPYRLFAVDDYRH